MVDLPKTAQYNEKVLDYFKILENSVKIPIY
jgi:hypothetical protein